MSEIANLLQTFGGWGVSAVLLYVCQRLYHDLRATEQARLKESLEAGERLHAALNEATALVRTIRGGAEVPR